MEYIPVSPLEVQTDLNAPYSELMGNDIKALLECDAIILLDGWETAKITGWRNTLPACIANLCLLKILFMKCDLLR